MFMSVFELFKKQLEITYGFVNQVRETIEKQLGQSMDDLFTNFVTVPLATASVRTFISLLPM